MTQPNPETETSNGSTVVGLDTQTKQLRAFGTKFHFDPNARGFTATVSTAIADHDGEVLLPSGMDKSIFRTNPLFLLYHNDQQFPMGEWDEKSVVQRSEGIVGHARFIDRSPLHPDGAEWLPDTALWYVQQGVIKALSVGLKRITSRPATTKDRHDFGPNCNFVTPNWKLLEISLCNIPTNVEALIHAVGKGIVGKSMLTELWEIPTRGKKSQIVVDKAIEPSKSNTLKRRQLPTMRLRRT